MNEGAQGVLKSKLIQVIELPHQRKHHQNFTRMLGVRKLEWWGYV